MEIDEDTLVPEQREIVRLYATQCLLVVQGPPGSGKSTAIRHMIIPNELTLLLAPTGGATDRLSSVCGETAYTIDRVLCSSELVKSFRGANIVVDEASMVSIDKAEEILKKLRPKRIAFVGDENQLPCQDGHPVLSTLLRCDGIHRVILNSNHRQQGQSALLRTISNMGKGADAETDDNFEVIACSSELDAIRRAIEFFQQQQAMEDEGEGEGALALAFTRDICAQVNRETKSALAGPAVYPDGPCVGDRVVCTKNIYHEKTRKILVANGTRGTIKTTGLVVYDNGFRDSKIKVPTERRPKGFRSEFEVARAMTVHKAQGNEFNIYGIVIVGGWGGSPPLELLYTALSRFKGKLAVFGAGRDLDKMFRRGEFKPILDVAKIAELKP